MLPQHYLYYQISIYIVTKKSYMTTHNIQVGPKQSKITFLHHSIASVHSVCYPFISLWCCYSFIILTLLSIINDVIHCWCCVIHCWLMRYPSAHLYVATQQYPCLISMHLPCSPSTVYTIAGTAWSRRLLYQELPPTNWGQGTRRCPQFLKTGGRWREAAPSFLKTGGRWPTIGAGYHALPSYVG